MKIHKKLQKGLIIGSLWTLGMSTIALPIITSVPTIVHADEEEKKDEDVTTESTNPTGSLTSGVTNAAIFNSYKDRSKYDFSTQYAITYNYLTSESFLSTGGYNNLYELNGVDNSFNVGIGTQLKSKPTIGQSATITNQSLNGDTALEDDKRTEEEKNSVKTTEDYTDDIVTDIMSEINLSLDSKFMTDTIIEPYEVKDFPWSAPKVRYKSVGSNKNETGSSPSSHAKEISDSTVKVYLRHAVTKANIQADKSGDSKEDQQKYITNSLVNALTYETVGKSIYPPRDKNKHTEGGYMTPNPTSDSINKSTWNKIDYNDTINYVNALQGNSNKSSKMTNLTNNKAITIQNSGLNHAVLTGSNFIEIKYDNNTDKKNDTAYLNDLFKYTYNPKLPKNTKTNFNNKTKSAVNQSKVQKSIAELIKLNGVASNELNNDANSKLVAYSTLQATNDNTTKDLDTKKYNKYLEKDDDSLSDLEKTNASAELQDIQKNQRALQVRDFSVLGSSHVMTGGTNAERGYIVAHTGGSSPIKSTKSLRQYLGIKYSDGEKGKKKEYTTADFKNLNQDYYNNGNVLYKAISSSKEYSNEALNNQKWGDSIVALAVDNYGNLIASETGDILIPYWQNKAFITTNSPISANVVLRNPSAYVTTALESNTKFFNLGNTRQTAINNLNSGASTYFTDSSAVETTIKNFLTTDDSSLESAFWSKAKQGGGFTKEEKSTLAMIITLATYKEVQTYNANFIKAVEGGSPFYVYPTASTFLSSEDYDDMKLTRWTAASLIQKIGWLFDYGLYELVRLTTTQMSVNMYDAISSWVGNIFYTDNITTSYAWQGLNTAIAGFFLAFIIVYSIYLAFHIFRKTISGKDGIKKILALTMVMIVPIFGYNFITDGMLNKPANFVLEDVIKQGLVVSFMEDKKQSQVDTMSDEMESAYNQIFGMNQANSEFTTKNYLMTFYTNTNRDGENVQDLDTLNVKSNNWFKSNNKTTNTVTNQYNKKKLIPVQASIFDLYLWSTDQVYARDGKPSDASETVKNNTYKNQTFFEYLAEKYSDDSSYSDLVNYTEYAIDLSTLYDTDVLATGVFSDSKNTTTYGKAEQGTITASELFYLMQRNSLNTTGNNGAEYKLQQGLRSLKQLSYLFTIDYKYTARDDVYIPTADDYETFIRDMSMTKSSRKQAYGSSDSQNFSDFTLSVLGKSEKYKIPNEVKQDYVPSEDYFGVYKTITDLMKNQTNNQANLKYDNAKKSTYRVSTKTLSTMSRKYSNLASVLDVDVENYETDSALQMAILLELYFNINKELGFKNFPTTYNAKTVGFDSLMKLYYVPMKDYNFQSYKISELTVRNLMEYVTLQENIFFIFLLFVAILALIVFWLLYSALFNFLMLFVILYKFIKEYIILNNYGNKSWLGTFYIYATFGLLRLGLAIIWWIGYTLINSAMASYGGLIYNIVFMHSIFIIFYIFMAFKFAILPLVKAVLEDKENLGANAVSSKLNQVRSSISMKAMGRGIARSPLNFARSSARNLRRAKNITKGGVNLSRRFSSKVNRGVSRGFGAVRDTKTAQMLGNKIAQGTENKMRTFGNGGNALADKVFNKQDKALTKEEEIFKKDGKSLSSTFGLIRNQQKRRKLGEKLSTNLNVGDIIEGSSKLGTTILELDSIPQEILASKGADMVKYLGESMGVMAKLVEKTDDKGNKYKTLAVDSTQYDLNTQDGRSAITLGLQNYAKEEMRSNNKNFTSMGMSEMTNYNENLPLFTTETDGSSLLVDTSSAYGIDYETLNQVFDKKSMSVSEYEKEFNKLTRDYNFEQVYSTGADGVSRLNESKYRITNKKGKEISPSEASRVMKSLSTIDESIRKRKNKPLRNAEDMEKLNGELYNFSEDELELVKDRLQGASGLSLIDNKMLVATTGKGYSELKAVKNEIINNRDLVNKGLKTFDNSLDAYASKGEGHGLLKTNVYNAQENMAEVQSLMGRNYGNKNAYVMAMDNNNNANSVAMLGALNTGNATARLTTDAKFMEAIKTKDNNRRELKTGINSALRTNAQLTGGAIDYIKENDRQIAQSPLFQEVMKDYNKLVENYKSGNISQERYNAELPYLSMQATEMLEHSSLLEGFSNTVNFDSIGGGFNNSQRDGLVSGIIESKETVKDKLKLSDIKDVDRNNINSAYVNDMKGLFGDNGTFTVNPLNNTATINTDNSLDISSKDNSNLMKKVLKSDYNRILRTSVDTENDSPIVEKYLNSIPRDIQEANLGKDMLKESSEVSPSVVVEDILNYKPKQNSHNVMTKPKKERNLDKEFTDKQNMLDAKVKKLLDNISYKKSQNIEPTKEEYEAYNKGSRKLAEIKASNSSDGFIEDKGKLIGLLNDLDGLEKDVNSDISKYISKSSNDDGESVVKMWSDNK